jgi:hypothetical protein
MGSPTKTDEVTIFEKYPSGKQVYLLIYWELNEWIEAN